MLDARLQQLTSCFVAATVQTPAWGIYLGVSVSQFALLAQHSSNQSFIQATTSSKYLVFKSIPLKTGENHISWISTTDCYLPTTPRGEIIQWALPCIWHTSKPLLSASTTLSSLIVTFIHTDEFRLRLDSVGLNAVDLPVWLHIVMGPLS